MMFINFNEGLPTISEGMSNIDFTIENGLVIDAKINPDYRLWLLSFSDKLYPVTWAHMRVSVSQGRVILYRAPRPNLRLGFNEDDLLVKADYYGV